MSQCSKLIVHSVIGEHITVVRCMNSQKVRLKSAYFKSYIVATSIMEICMDETAVHVFKTGSQDRHMNW